jgi:hypothetical protein
MTNSQVTYLVGACCGLLALIAFGTFVVAPAISAYRRPTERVAVVILSLYVLAALIGIGVVVGAVIIYEWPRYF